ncbi:MAG TPA: 2-amino-4-hydroxy-6-hydroxymethyldihydropteridine diphosphokinase [Burkholderiaceae bacterium]|nr:2-amino-4-hydroxy-6-hydroxymethyldihydropteridine diphosphokinase [Burkholderiaceae bacterium]
MPRSTTEPPPAARDVEAFIGLGANLGDPHATLTAAFDALVALPESTLTQRSSFYRTAPIDSGGPDYLNAVARLRTRLPALELLAQLQAIERAHGRERPYRNAPRTLDLDLLLYGDEQWATPALELPHPRAHERAFVLAPLAEIAPDLVIPGRGRVAELLAGLPDQRIERLAPSRAID